MKNLWLLTEERPKKEVIATIFQKFAKDFRYAVFIDTICKLIKKKNRQKLTFLAHGCC
jgi:hypothetical protein